MSAKVSSVVCVFEIESALACMVSKTGRYRERHKRSRRPETAPVCGYRTAG